MEVQRRCMLCNRPCGEEGLEAHLVQCLTAAPPRWEGQEKARAALGQLPRIRYDVTAEEELSNETLPKITVEGVGESERERAREEERGRRDRERAERGAANSVERKSESGDEKVGEGMRETPKRRRPAPSRAVGGNGQGRMRPTVRVEHSERQQFRHSLHITGTERESPHASVTRAPSGPNLRGGDRRSLKSSVSRESTEEEELKELGRWDTSAKSQKKSLTAGAVGLVRALSPRNHTSSPLTKESSATQGEQTAPHSQSNVSNSSSRASHSLTVTGRAKLHSLTERQKNSGGRQDLYCTLTALQQNSPSVAAVAALKNSRTPIHQLAHKALVVVFCPSNFHFLRMNKAGEVEASMSTANSFQPDAIFTLYVNGDGSYRFRCKFWGKYLWSKQDVVDSASSLFVRKKKDLEKLCLSGGGLVVPEGSAKGTTEPAALHVLPLHMPPS